MKVSFAVPIKPQPQGSITSFLLPNREACMAAAKMIFVSPKMSISEIADLIVATAKKLRIILTSDNPELKKYRRDVSAQATIAMKRCGQEMAGKHVPVELHLEFFFVRPESVTKSRHFPVVKPDLDKLCRAAMDSLSEIVYLDDAQVVTVAMTKRYGPRQCVSITAETVETLPAAPTLFPDLPPEEEPF